MKSNYKKIGDYIQLVDVRNKDLSITKLLGLTVNKVFIPSVANIIGTNMKNYKIIRKGQFACSIMQVRRDKKMPIALLEEFDEAIISQAYPIFEVVDKKKLLPEYLMMWFSRTEFDRQATFYAVGGVRGSLEWEDFLDFELPIPSIEKQNEIVKEYNIIVNRIKLNEQLNKKLEETAQAIYKHWFVDFEFPNENGKAYKSSGGKMVFNAELEKDIPEGWDYSELGKMMKEKGYIRGPFGSALKVGDMQSEGTPVYEQQHILDEHRKFRYYISETKYNQLKRFSVEPNDIVISCSGVNLGKLSLIKETDPIGIINQALLILRANKEKVHPIILKYFLESKEGNRFLIQEAGGSAIPNIAKREVIQSIPFLSASSEINEKLSQVLEKIERKIINGRDSIDSLLQFKDLVLSKMSKVELEKEVEV